MSEQLFDILGIFVFMVGLCIGSFLNVVALRAFTGESIVLPPSKCPKCGEKIKPYDNIPVLSWLILGGQCRNCKNSISIQYPIVELLTGFGFLMFYYHFKRFFIGTDIIFQQAVLLPFFLIIFCIAIVISITDIKEKVVFDVHTISLAIVILIFQFMAGNLINSLIGLVIGALSMEFLSGLGWILVRKRAFGTGDTYIAAAIGALLGAKMFFYALITAVIIQVLCVIPSYIKKLYKNQEYRTLLMSAIFCSLIIMYKIAFIDSFSDILKYLFIVLMMIVGLYLCKLLLSVKSLKDNPSYWPFGPSLLISMFLVAFYGGDIAHFISTIFY